MNYFKGAGKRLLYVVATFLNWLVYILILASSMVFNFVLWCFRPILWVLIGGKNLDVLDNKLYNHSNDELWLRDVGEDPSNFNSMWPRWGFYIQEHYLDKLIEND